MLLRYGKMFAMNQCYETNKYILATIVTLLTFNEETVFDYILGRKVLCSHCGKTVDGCLPGCDAVWSRRWRQYVPRKRWSTLHHN
jgi:hypothetical protein